MTDIRTLLPEELSAALKELGEPAFRAKQIFSWLGRGAASYEEMTNISKSLRAKLSERYALYAPKILQKQVSQCDGTIKYLWELFDGNAIETVVMKYHHGNTVCISSQVGCRQGCAFCASTIGGLVRNLGPEEMLNQVLFSEKDAGEPISNIVIMGIGEPLDNFENVKKFLALVNHPEGRNLGMRHITLSTCGLTEHFEELETLGLQCNLAISLHAPDDETRSRLMPANRGRGVESVVAACADYFKKTGRRVTFEYAMIHGVNDSPEQAALLAKAAAKVGAHINLIPLNKVSEREFSPSSPERQKAFEAVLTAAHCNYTVRRRLGPDIDASCGQLRRKRMAASEE